MFQLTKAEAEGMWSQFVTTYHGPNRSQIVTGSQKHRNPDFLPYAFTEQGIAMLSSVLKSKRAVQVNIMIMRTFVKLREIMATHAELARKIEEMERKYGEHDRHIQKIFKIIKELLEPPPAEPEAEGAPMGFGVG
jgi:hypothetical protein